MGQSSSQLTPSQAQNNTQLPDDSTELSQLRLDGAAMDSPADRDEEVRVVKKKRKVSGDAVRPAKRSKKDREGGKTADDTREGSELERLEVEGTRRVNAADEVTQQRKKKKARKEALNGNEDDIVDGEMATQQSLLSTGAPQSTMDSTNDGSVKTAKIKRKRPSGRPSGLNLQPAMVSDQATQEVTATQEIPATQEILETQDEPAPEPATTQWTPVNASAQKDNTLESPVQPESVTQTKSKKSKDSASKKRRSKQLSPDMTQPQAAPKATKSPRTNRQHANGATTNGHDDVEQSTEVQQQKAAKRPKAAKKRKSQVQEEEAVTGADMLPTPPEATQDAPLRTNEPVLPSVPAQEANYGTLRDDYSEVDATDQVRGWLSEQMQDGNSPTIPHIAPSGDGLRKKAIAKASSKREFAAQIVEEKATKKRRRVSHHHDDDSEDYEPNEKEEEPNRTQERPRNSARRRSERSKRAEDADEGISDGDLASPAASKKKRRSLKRDEETVEKSTTKEHKRARVSEADPRTPMAKSKRKTRPEPPSDDDKEDEYVQPSTASNADDDTAEENKSKKKPAARALSRTRQLAVEGEELRGPFTQTEKEQVDGLFQDTLKDLGWSDAYLREYIKDWKNASEWKEAVVEILPGRSLAAIRKFCQRRFHNMERGAWTPEQDESLKRAYAATPDKWTEIGALVGRTGPDCKDRWINNLSIQQSMQLGPWSQEEETALVKVVDECIKDIKQARKEEASGLSRAELEQSISWSVVSKKLEGARSAKRCKEKWHQLKHRDAVGHTTVQFIPTGLDKSVSSKKLRSIEKDYNQCDVGDLYDILTEIHTAIPDHTKEFDLESTLWSIVSTKNKGSRFKSAMRRRGLHDAAEVYADEIGEHPTFAATAKALADHLEGQWGVEALAEKRAYVPTSKKVEVKSAERVDSDDDDVEAPRASKKFKSSEQVVSDEEDVEDDSNLPAGQIGDPEVADSQPTPRREAVDSDGAERVRDSGRKKKSSKKSSKEKPEKSSKKTKGRKA